jgi:hypothetical protein
MMKRAYNIIVLLYTDEKEPFFLEYGPILIIWSLLLLLGEWKKDTRRLLKERQENK